jgi:hypothetical protein
VKLLKITRIRACRVGPLVDRVHGAIKYGARTQREIMRATALSADEVGDALATLILWTGDPERKVYSQNGSGPRIYFLEGQVLRKRTVYAPREPTSFGISTVYSQGEPEKLSTFPRNGGTKE